MIPLGLIAAASAKGAAILKKTFGSDMTALITSKEKMEDILKIVKSLKESGLLIKGVSETINSETKEQKDGFLRILLDTLAASMLGNMSAEKPKIPGRGVTRAGQAVI